MKELTIAVVVIVIAAVAYLAGTGQLGTTLPFQQTPGTSLSSIYHSVIDPMDPNYLKTRQLDCINASGIWFDQADRIGCFSIPPGAWDSRQCEGPVMRYFENICNGITDAHWTCLSFEAGCHY